MMKNLELLCWAFSKLVSDPKHERTCCCQAFICRRPKPHLDSLATHGAQMNYHISGARAFHPIVDTDSGMQQDIVETNLYKCNITKSRVRPSRFCSYVLYKDGIKSWSLEFPHLSVFVRTTGTALRSTNSKISRRNPWRTLTEISSSSTWVFFLIPFEFWKTASLVRALWVLDWFSLYF